MTKANYIIKSRATEKAIIATDKNKFVLNVRQDANKNSLHQEIVSKYKVTPIKINIINTGSRSVMRRGRPGTISGFKKAIVTLKKGEKLEIA